MLTSSAVCLQNIYKIMYLLGFLGMGKGIEANSSYNNDKNDEKNHNPNSGLKWSEKIMGMKMLCIILVL